MPIPEPRVIVGAYASAPAEPYPDLRIESELLERLATLPGVRGLEVPGRGSPYPYGLQWYLESTPEHWDLVLTQVGSTVQHVQERATYGLASDAPEGRAQALRDVERLREDVRALNDALGRRSVLAVELHSAPATTRASSSAAALAESLREIAAWDWDGAAPLVEHCDAHRPGRNPAKGFLPLDLELEALARSQTGVGVVLNWGRSAIELRDADLVAPTHVRQAREAGALRAVVFSGASDVESAYGQAWADSHQPFAPVTGSAIGSPGSLLDDHRAQQALAAAGDLDWVGLKVSCRPQPASVAHRLAVISDGVDRVIAAHAGLGSDPDRATP